MTDDERKQIDEWKTPHAPWRTGQIVEMKMNAKELAAKLNGREYGEEINDDECKAAQEAGLLVVFGYSDDNVELRGVIEDEVGAFEGTTIKITDKKKIAGGYEGEIQDAIEVLERAGYDVAKPCIICTIKAEWCDHIRENAGPWTMSSDCPYEPFTINEDGEPFCRGIVIDIAALNQNGGK